MQRRVLCQRRKVAGIHRQSPLWQRGVLELPCIEETFAGVFLRTVKKVGLERVVKDVLMRLWGVQKGCVKISELFASILFAPVAQRIERRFPKPCVGGSSPLGGASIFRPALGGPFLFDVARYGEWLKTRLVVIQPMGEFIGRCVYGGTDFAIVSRLRPAYSVASPCRPPVPLIALVPP